MPATRFWALYGEISAIRADELREQASVAVVAAHPGEDGAAYRDLLERLDEIADDGDSTGEEPVAAGHSVPADKLINVGMPGVVYEAEPGSILAERERQKANWLKRVEEARQMGIIINT